jgi:hypothetical protein
MESTLIPDTKLTVSRIALGTWAIGGWMWGGTDEKASVATIERAVAGGISRDRPHPARLYLRSGRPRIHGTARPVRGAPRRVGLTA